jgi:NAD(P)-dependent dehydrogenase (short-subunit alcohol dehydrogenase family)
MTESANSPSAPDFGGLVVIVTGASAGLGRQYALDFGARGARVVVSARRADAVAEVVDHIRAIGGEAVASVTDAREGAAIVAAALDAYGTVDALVVNAGFVRDRTFARMTEAEWSEVIGVHLQGTYAAATAVWPHMVAQGSGRIVLTTSGAALHGSFGQANYAAAKGAIIGLAKTLALEGARYGVAVNAVAPMACTQLTRGILDEELLAALPAELVSPFVLALAHPSCPQTGAIVETGGGWAALLRWQRSAGIRLAAGEISPAAVLARWDELADFTANADYPATIADSLAAAGGGPASAAGGGPGNTAGGGP